MMTITSTEIEGAALVLLVTEDGSYRWSSSHSDVEVAQMLEGIADELHERAR
jgi:hypothetical protein